MIHHSDLSLILGPPGTGKTTRLLNIMHEELAAGVKPNRIGFFAFTKKAAAEAVERASERFNLDPQQLPWYRTIHSLCYQRLGIKKSDVIGFKHYRELGERLGMELKNANPLDSELYGMDDGDRLLFLEGQARATGKTLEQTFIDADEPGLQYSELYRLARGLDVYKHKQGLVDFTDMLQMFVEKPSLAPDLDVAIIDEAQDLTQLQWRVMAAVCVRAKRVYVAGDDDQAIYRWSGADVDAFMSLIGKTEVLGQSYRIPSAVHDVAADIAGRMSKRNPKQWKARDEKGLVRWYPDPEAVDMSADHWMLLVRNGYMLPGLEDMCRLNGYSYEVVGRKENPLTSPALKAIIAYSRLVKYGTTYKPDMLQILTWVNGFMPIRERLKKISESTPITLSRLQELGWPQEPPIWHQFLTRIPESDREYFLAARRRGESLVGKPRIRISTIHTSKGGEADHVMLLTDMSQRTSQEMERKPDDEHRVWYVAVTRARQGLHVIEPGTGNFYQV
jgi:superfamily I DNA/RNA helicase